MNKGSTHKERRHKVISEILRTQKIASQTELLQAVQEIGLQTTQASLSRDIAEMGILKEGGHYVLHPTSFYQGEAHILSIQSAGPNLLVIKTAAGSASLVGAGIDEGKIDGVIGTIAGDDTVFVALSHARRASAIKKEIWRRFRPTPSH